MTTWRLAHGPLRCGHCHTAIAAGQAYLEYRVGAVRLLRCQPCGENMTGAPAPDVIEESAPALDVQPQPSLSGLEPIDAVEPVWRRRVRR